MKRITALLLGLTVAAMAVLVSATPAQAGISSCPSHQTFGRGDSRLTWNGSHWRTPKYRSSRGACNGVFILHQGHWSYVNGGDFWDGSYRIRTYNPDGVTVNYTGPWRRLVYGSSYYNIRPEVSDGRIFEIQEVATTCLLNGCGSSHKPMFSLTY